MIKHAPHIFYLSKKLATYFLFSLISSSTWIQPYFSLNIVKFILKNKVVASQLLSTLLFFNQLSKRMLFRIAPPIFHSHRFSTSFHHLIVILHISLFSFNLRMLIVEEFRSFFFNHSAHVNSFSAFLF